MKPLAARKSPRFFVINPVNDRRTESRFNSEEPVKVKNLRTHQLLNGTAFEVGHYGLRLEVARCLSLGDQLQIEFPKRPENIGCWGKVVWCEPKEGESLSSGGVAIESWYGIIDGPHSWKRMKGVTMKKDRRQKLR